MARDGDKVISVDDLKKVTYTFIVGRDEVGVLADELELFVYEEGLCKANLGIHIEDVSEEDLKKASLEVR